MLKKKKTMKPVDKSLIFFFKNNYVILTCKQLEKIIILG